MTLFIIIFVVLLLPVIYNLVFPFKRPNLDNYFSVGQTFSSKAEGVTQTITQIVGNRIYCNIRFEPNAIGPTEHLHVSFDESVTVVQGMLTTKVDGIIKEIHCGERLFFPKGIYHKMYNQTNEVVILHSEKEEDYIPIEFAYSLTQLYPILSLDGKLTLNVFLKICVLDEWFDSVPLGLPPAFFSIIKKVVKPYARLLGVTPYDSKSRRR
jgi:uncharacterized cupin superfamily protein